MLLGRRGVRREVGSRREDMRGGTSLQMRGIRSLTLSLACKCDVVRTAVSRNLAMKGKEE